ncbi:KipI antagonist [Thalassocella blandensis]|nr:KipI antagonist [Thalassocella blandensis]
MSKPLQNSTKPQCPNEPASALTALNILHAGPMTTLQDLGRQGGQHLGYCQSGAADEYSYLWANKLLDNDINCAALEICFGPFECEFEFDTLIAITGSMGKVQINQSFHDGWQSFLIKAGDRLKIHAPSNGIYTYLAIKQGFQLPAGEKMFFGSVAMVPREQSGPFEGKKFERLSFERLPFESASKAPLYYGYSPPTRKKAQDFYSHKQQRRVPWQFIPNYASTLELGLILSYQSSQLSAERIEHIFQDTYHLSADSNKMGARLEGPEIKFDRQHLLSEGVAFGAVQIPANGQPIILLKDRQTIGGYPKIGCICLLDAFRLSQSRPGQKIKFKPVELTHSYRELRQWQNFFGQTLGKGDSG